ncbi:hypothetical protein E2C01_072969 [Portunus trituberculatus]|uniref:Uncharacterized protein n=1 Tax=Portunus trituberculatus TaxID=210409 RepID=A0A5B7I848_PORTR|nr:hypothetical protein [Portunus trituberculatus]
MTLGQSSPQLGGREGDIIGLHSSGRKILWRLRAPGAAGSFRETLAKCSAKRSATVLGSATVCPADNKTGGAGAEYFPAIRRTLLKTSVRGVRALMEET